MWTLFCIRLSGFLWLLVVWGCLCVCFWFVCLWGFLFGFGLRGVFLEGEVFGVWFWGGGVVLWFLKNFSLQYAQKTILFPLPSNYIKCTLKLGRTAHILRLISSCFLWSMGSKCHIAFDWTDEFLHICKQTTSNSWASVKIKSLRECIMFPLFFQVQQKMLYTCDIN